MSNKNMRARNLDHAKPLVVQDSVHDEQPERLDIASGITRTTKNAPKGMEKEEELVRPYLCLQHVVCSTSFAALRCPVIFIVVLY